MTSDALAYYRETQLARLGRLWRLRRAYSDVANETGTGMMQLCYRAVLRDCYDAGLSTSAMLAQLSFAPPPPAKPSPDGRT